MHFICRRMNNSFYPLKYDNLALDDFYKELPEIFIEKLGRSRNLKSPAYLF